MEPYKIKSEYIPLNQLMKLVGWCENAAEANVAIENGLVKVNGSTEYRKRNKLLSGYKVDFKGQTVLIE